MKILVPFYVPTEDLKKFDTVNLPVEINISETNIVNGEIEYKVIIPDFMFEELANTEPQFKTEYDVNNHKVSGLFSNRTVRKKFQKTQTAILISQLKDYFYELTTHIVEKHSIENQTLKKKIFICFNHSKNHCKNNLNGAYIGEEIEQTFRYFTGYEVLTDKYSNLLEDKKIKKNYISKIFYASEYSLRKKDTGFKEVDDLFLPLPNLNQTIESFEKEYSIIDWTEEREEFCKKIKETFEKVNTELSNFLKNLDSDKIDYLMSSNGLKFLK